MCMHNIKRKELKTRTAWKILEYYRYYEKWKTPYQSEPVKNNKLIAKGKIDIKSPEYLCSGSCELHGGAIHCYRTRKEAKKNCMFWQAIFKVVGTGYIAHNNEQIAFKSVKFVDNVDDWEM